MSDHEHYVFRCDIRELKCELNAFKQRVKDLEEYQSLKQNPKRDEK